MTFKHPEGLQLALPNNKTQFQIFTFGICVEKFEKQNLSRYVNVLEVRQSGTIKTTLSQGL